MEHDGHRLSGVVFVAAVAVAGILSMHALDPMVFGSEGAEGHTVHATEGVSRGLHGAMGLCVFVLAAVAGSAPSFRSRPLPRGVPEMVWRPVTTHQPPVVSASGRERLTALCVLTL